MTPAASLPIAASAPVGRSASGPAMQARSGWPALLSLVLVVGIPPQGARAQAGVGRVRDLQAEQFVETQAQRIVTTLSNRKLAEAEKRETFRRVVDEIVDVPRVTTFVLGRYSRTLSPVQRQGFGVVFRAYAQTVYERRIGDYHGEGLKVTGSVMRKPGDVIVASTLSGGRVSSTVPISWRVLSSSGSWKVVDVQVKGVWLAILQQQDFVSTLDNAGGDIGPLIAQLKRASISPDR